MSPISRAKQPDAKRLFIVTGDPSGDIHAANIVKALLAREPKLEIAAVGGVKLKEAGVELLSDQSKMARVGFGSFLGAPYHYFLGKRILKFLKSFKPQVVLLIDYGGFNLWLAKHLKAAGHTVCYFIPPQVWASRPGRIRKIKQYIDHVFCIFPFEEPLYRQHGVPVTFVGHPLVGQLPPPADREAFCREVGLDPAEPIVGLFPGSRRMELDYLLEPVLQAVPKIHAAQPGTQFVLAKSAALDADYFRKRFEQASQGLGKLNVSVVENRNHALLSVADMLVLASGTVTLEAALYKTPMVIIYRGHPLAYEIFKRLVRLPCIGLPNILTDVQHPFIRELLQDWANPEAITQAILPYFDPESEESRKARAGFAQIEATLGHTNAPENLARELLSRFF